MGSRFGEEGRKLSYGTYLKVPELLDLQHGLSQEHDELLFIVAHQAYELWFKVVLDELEATRDRIDADDIFFARHHLRRVYVIEFLSGLKEPKYMARLESTPEEKARLQRRLDEPSVADAFHTLVQRRGSP